jgi:hypothetical protein
MDDLGSPTLSSSPGFTRRGFLKGTLGLGVLAGVTAVAGDFWFDSGFAFGTDGPTVAIPSTGTAPEQVHLEWGADPETAMTVSWLSPGSQAQPAPSLVWSTSAITSTNPGTSVTVTHVPYVDGGNSETFHAYHAPITGLTPATAYSYQISDGASPATTYAGTFTTAPADTARTAWAFTSYGDLGTPTAHLSTSGTSWNESSDNAYFAVSAIMGETQGAHGVAPLFHLLNGDLCYANLNYNSQPAVWRDFGNNVQRAASAMPWMPCLGNHEIEFGGNGANGSGTGIYNGPYGYGNYQTRYLLPDNGVSGYRNNFYSFQVGTVLFISLDADDVVYQDGGSYYAPSQTTPATSPPSYANETLASGVVIKPGQSTYNNQYTGALTSGPNDSLVPDTSQSQPNQQTTWLANTLSAARNNPNTLYPGKLPIDMIVVQMHQCALSSSSSGNGSDLGIRQAWLPLFEQYGVDLVVSGHEHNYERSYAIKGYNPSSVGTVVAPNPGQAASGSAVNTRQPTAVPAAQTTSGGLPAFDTSQGTVYLVLGGGGTDGPTNVYGTDSSGNPQAKVITQRNQIYVNSSGNYTKNGADSIEPAPWSAMRDVPNTGTSSPGYAYGFARFDVSPGAAAGDTTIVMSYYHAERTGSGSSYVGTTSYSLLEQVAYGRNLAANPAGPGVGLPEFAAPALALGAAAAIGVGALYLANRDNGAGTATDGAAPAEG